jgi:hypothetical protein
MYEDHMENHPRCHVTKSKLKELTKTIELRADIMDEGNDTTYSNRMFPSWTVNPNTLSVVLDTQFTLGLERANFGDTRGFTVLHSTPMLGRRKLWLISHKFKSGECTYMHIHTHTHTHTHTNVLYMHIHAHIHTHTGECGHFMRQNSNGTNSAMLVNRREISLECGLLGAVVLAAPLVEEHLFSTQPLTESMQATLAKWGGGVLKTSSYKHAVVGFPYPLSVPAEVNYMQVMDLMVCSYHSTPPKLKTGFQAQTPRMEDLSDDDDGERTIQHYQTLEEEATKREVVAKLREELLPEVRAELLATLMAEGTGPTHAKGTRRQGGKGKLG